MHFITGDVFLSQMSYLVFDEIDMLYEEGFDKDVDNLVTIAKVCLLANLLLNSWFIVN